MQKWNKPELKVLITKDLVKLLKVNANSYGSIVLTPESIELLNNAAIGQEFWVYDTQARGWLAVKEYVDAGLQIIGLTIIGLGSLIWNCLTNCFGP